MADYLEVQFKQVVCNTTLETSIKNVTGNEVRKIIKGLKHMKSPGHNDETSAMS